MTRFDIVLGPLGSHESNRIVMDGSVLRGVRAIAVTAAADDVTEVTLTMAPCTVNMDIITEAVIVSQDQVVHPLRDQGTNYVIELPRPTTFWKLHAYEARRAWVR